MTIRLSKRAVICTLATILCQFANSADAFVVDSYMDGNETLYLKWGDNHAGSLGGTVTWSFIPAGTPGSTTYCASACPGTSVDSVNIENFPGGGFTATPLTSLESHIIAMMDRWAAVSGIQFVKEDSDSGVAINDPGAAPPATGQIRIGVFAFDGDGYAGVGYAPPPNGGTGAGDILINANAYFQFAPGNEGDAFDQTNAPNDFDSLILHELGHAIGLEHPPYDGTCPVMQVYSDCLGHINREL
ncbi:MAG: hypothetical protein WBV39_14210, partial [Rudaea sp.]